ncbi:MAG: hypothetical protein KJZ83_15890, partial [Burkholderiaceae bacterium]|nr:hypothetical protein [Burkholderiaceae bacterium]
PQGSAPAPTPRVSARQGSASGPAAGAPSPAAPSAVATGTARLTVIPWGQVYVDGKLRGVSPPLKQLTLPEGRHEIEFRNGDAVARRSVTVRAGRSVSVEHRF